MNPKPCVYILKTSNERYYVGSTNDLGRRIIEHKSGKSKYTKNVLPVELVFFENFDTLKDARRMELAVKRY